MIERFFGTLLVLASTGQGKKNVFGKTTSRASGGVSGLSTSRYSNIIPSAWILVRGISHPGSMPKVSGKWWPKMSRRRGLSASLIEPRGRDRAQLAWYPLAGPLRRSGLCLQRSTSCLYSFDPPSRPSGRYSTRQDWLMQDGALRGVRTRGKTLVDFVMLDRFIRRVQVSLGWEGT